MMVKPLPMPLIGHAFAGIVRLLEGEVDLGALQADQQIGPRDCKCN